MLKHLILLFNFISFIIITALLPADIKINTKLPENASFVRDSTYIIEVSIEKGSIFGFAKFQQNIPQGFTAHPVETADASFTFADDKIKFIWMAIPETNVVKLSYALTATQDAPNEGFIAGKFSYIEENERRSYDIPSITINVVSDAPVIEKTPAVANVTRTVQELGNFEYEVKINVAKSGIKGFAKLEEYLPDGVQASVKSNNKAVFSQVDEKAKFVWMAIPETQNLEVSYTVKSNSDVLSALSSMQGNFSFLDENETKTVAVIGTEALPSEIASVETIEPVSPEVKSEVNKVEPNSTSQPESTESVAAAEPVNTVEPMVTKDESIVATSEEIKPESTPTAAKPEPVVSKEEPVIAAVEESTPIKETTPVKEDTPIKEVDKQIASSNSTSISIPNPETGIAYKVQVVAGHKMVTEAYLRKAYNFQEKYAIENHEGWIKYTTGQFDEYKRARDKREQIAQAGHNFPGPFVTAYNAGERITVQEALMISNQKWFK